VSHTGVNEDVPDLRVLLHALDRTGPPMLALVALRWLARTKPDWRMQVVAFRGGPLVEELATFAEVRVVLEPEVPWDGRMPSPDLYAEASARMGQLGRARLNLILSVAGGLVLPLLPVPAGPIATWSVEMGEDLHWLDEPLGLVERTDGWLAGSQTTAAELVERPALPDQIAITPEYIEDPPPEDAALTARRRLELSAPPEALLVVGVGIGTPRKGMDLFVETALEVRRQDPRSWHFAWIGGSSDRLYADIEADLLRHGIDHVSLHPPVADLVSRLRAADIFLHPARIDSFPLVCLHAAAVGRPVVAFSDSGGVTEMMGRDLVGAPFPDVAALAAEVVALADPGHRARVGAAHRTAVAPNLASAAVPKLVAAVEGVGRGAAA